MEGSASLPEAIEGLQILNAYSGENVEAVNGKKNSTQPTGVVHTLRSAFMHCFTS